MLVFKLELGSKVWSNREAIGSGDADMALERCNFLNLSTSLIRGDLSLCQNVQMHLSGGTLVTLLPSTSLVPDGAYFFFYVTSI